MVVLHEEFVREPHYDAFSEPHKWRTPPIGSWRYSLEDELLDQLAKLPEPERVDELITKLHIPTLRQLTIEVVNGGVKFAKGGDPLGYLRLVNSWIATAEERVAAGSRLQPILHRRKKTQLN